MKKLISAALISLFVVVAISANAGPYEDGVAAYERKDYVTAVKLWRFAAEQGDNKAQYDLGMMYGNGGGGLTQDYVRAHMWLNIAVSNGNKGAWFNLAVVAEMMSQTQVGKAQEMAQLCMKSNFKNCY